MDRVQKTTRVVIRLALALALVAVMGCPDALDDFKERMTEKPAPKVEEVAERNGIVEKTLENGLAVVALENFSSPVTSVQVWIAAGAADEDESQAGIAHQLEHMMFKGTETRPRGQLAQIVESLGGELNAFTSYDQTVYYINIASRYFDRAIELLADQVQNATLDAAELAKEKEVVLEEIRRGQDEPRTRAYQYLFDAAYSVHPYRRPIIGDEKTVSRLTRDDLVRFYRRWYVPGKMTVVVVGANPTAEVLAAAGKYFGPPPADPGPSDSPRSRTEPAQGRTRAKIFREEVADGYLFLGFHIPAFVADDIPALDLISVILGGGESSRLHYRVATTRRLVDRIFAMSYTPKDPGLFLISADADEARVAKALDMVLKQTYLLKHEPVEDWELEKAKASIQADSIYARETMEGQARRLGFFKALTGDPDHDRVYIEKVKALTKEDVQRVAQRYFQGPNLTVTAIMPRAGKGDAPELTDQTAIDVVNNADRWDQGYRPGSLVEKKPIAPPEVPVTEPVPVPRPDKKPQPASLFKLKNGARLIVKESHAVSLVAVTAAFSGGSRLETKETNGINNLIANAITEGSANHSSSQIHSMIEARAGSISGFSGRNSIGVNLLVPSFYFRSCLPLLIEILRYPTFPEEEVARMKQIVTSSIRSQMDEPSYVVRRVFREELFRTHPSRLDPQGSEASVKRLTRDNLTAFYEQIAVPDNLVITVVGDLDPQAVKAELEQMIGDWPSAGYHEPNVPPEPPPDSPRRRVECRDANQAHVVVGFQGVTVHDPDRYPLDVIASALSGMSGRLFMNLRDDRSLAYAVYATNDPGVDPGAFAAYIGAAPEKEEAAKTAILDELLGLAANPLSPDELARGKETIIGDYEIQMQRFSRQAAAYALDELFGLGFGHVEKFPELIEAVSADDVKRVAAKYLRADASVTAVVRPCSGDKSAATPPAAGPHGNR